MCPPLLIASEARQFMLMDFHGASRLAIYVIRMRYL
jgi:hypothetical protein